MGFQFPQESYLEQYDLFLMNRDVFRFRYKALLKNQIVDRRIVGVDLRWKHARNFPFFSFWPVLLKQGKQVFFTADSTLFNYMWSLRKIHVGNLFDISFRKVVDVRVIKASVENYIWPSRWYIFSLKFGTFPLFAWQLKQWEYGKYVYRLADGSIWVHYIDMRPKEIRKFVPWDPSDIRARRILVKDFIAQNFKHDPLIGRKLRYLFAMNCLPTTISYYFGIRRASYGSFYFDPSSYGWHFRYWPVAMNQRRMYFPGYSRGSYLVEPLFARKWLVNYRWKHASLVQKAYWLIKAHFRLNSWLRDRRFHPDNMRGYWTDSLICQGSRFMYIDTQGKLVRKGYGFWGDTRALRYFSWYYDEMFLRELRRRKMVSYKALWKPFHVLYWWRKKEIIAFRRYLASYKALSVDKLGWFRFFKTKLLFLIPFGPYSNRRLSDFSVIPFWKSHLSLKSEWSVLYNASLPMLFETKKELAQAFERPMMWLVIEPEEFEPTFGFSNMDVYSLVIYFFHWFLCFFVFGVLILFAFCFVRNFFLCITRNLNGNVSWRWV